MTMNELKPASVFAKECIIILRDKYNATPTETAHQLFFYSQASRISGSEAPVLPHEEVKRLLQATSPKALGITEEGTLKSFRDGLITEGVAMELLKLDRLAVRSMMADVYGDDWRDQA